MLNICRRLTACIALVLGGCAQGGPEDRFDNYLSRLSNALSVTAAPPLPTDLPRLPRPAVLQLALESASLDTLDFLALSGCEVQINIGRRNSSLGRLAYPSQLLLLDLEYLRLAPACIEHLKHKGRQPLAQTLQSAILLKQQQLPARIFMATLASTEFRSFWQPAPTLADYPNQTGSTVPTALENMADNIRHWLAGDYQADNLQFELDLGEVAKGDGGRLMQALALQSSWLENANQLLSQRQQKAPLCTDTLRFEAADILPNIMQRFFIGDIQPWSAALSRRYHNLLPAIKTLESLLEDTLPPAYRQWQLQRNSTIEYWYQAPVRHVHALQDILEPCGGGLVQAKR
ncbi:MAG: DUF3080 family protein [Parahaliea sp.]